MGGGKKLYDYRYAFNGFAAQLTEAQANALESSKDVMSVEQAEKWELDTSTTPGFLGLTGANGLWAQLGGPSSGTTPGTQRVRAKESSSASSTQAFGRSIPA